MKVNPIYEDSNRNSYSFPHRTVRRPSRGACSHLHKPRSPDRFPCLIREDLHDYVVEGWLAGFLISWRAGWPVSVQKPFFLVFSSLRSSFDREIPVQANSFFIFFGTEALKAKNCVHEYSRI